MRRFEEEVARTKHSKVTGEVGRRERVCRDKALKGRWRATGPEHDGLSVSVHLYMYLCNTSTAIAP